MRKAMNIICGILAELCALAVIFLGAYFAYTAKASSLDQSYVSRQQEQVSHRKIHKATPGKTATMRQDTPPTETRPPRTANSSRISASPPGVSNTACPFGRAPPKPCSTRWAPDTTTPPPCPAKAATALSPDTTHSRTWPTSDCSSRATSSTSKPRRTGIGTRSIRSPRSSTGHAPTAAGVERGLTLQTCWPIMAGGDVTHRLIVHGELDGWAPKSDGTPAEYTESTDTTIDKVNRRIVIVSERTNLPVTGMLGICAFIIWILLDATAWMSSHRRMTCYWHGRDIGGPITWLWRLNAGIMPSSTIVFTITRTIVFLMMWTAIILALWRWACPPLAAMHFLTS